MLVVIFEAILIPGCQDDYCLFAVVCVYGLTIEDGTIQKRHRLHGKNIFYEICGQPKKYGYVNKLAKPMFRIWNERSKDTHTRCFNT